MDELEKEVESAAEPTETIDAVFDEKNEQPVETPANPWDGFTPSKYGLEERYDKLSPEQFAKEIQFRNQTAGRHSQEIGELRRRNKEYEEKLARFMEAADKPVETRQQVDDLDEYTKEKYYKLLELGKPREATKLVLGDMLKPKYDSEDFHKAVDERVKEHLGQYYAYTSEESIKRDPDYPEHAEYIDLLKEENHFGNTRRPEELLNFSKLVKENKSLADLTYHNMKQYPSMSFDDSLKFASLTLNASSLNDKKKADYQAQVKKLDGVTPPAGNTVPGNTEEKIESMDDAFNV
jgi:hypothetical protein